MFHENSLTKIIKRSFQRSLHESGIHPIVACCTFLCRDGFFNPTVNVQVFPLSKVVDSKSLVLHRLLVAADSDVTVYHFYVI
jgi:hypothetical protein